MAARTITRNYHEDEYAASSSHVVTVDEARPTADYVNWDFTQVHTYKAGDTVSVRRSRTSVGMHEGDHPFVKTYHHVSEVDDVNVAVMETGTVCIQAGHAASVFVTADQARLIAEAIGAKVTR